MHIESIEIENYKCFWKTQKIKLEHGFNLFVGANNSGKTTALEALDLAQGINEPHCSVKSIARYGDKTTGQSRFVVRLSTEIQEMHRVLGSNFYVLLPQELIIPTGQEGSVVNSVLESPRVNLEVRFGNGQDELCFETAMGRSGLVSQYRPNETFKSIAFSYVNTDSPLGFSVANYSGIGGSAGAYHNAYKQFIYRFSAQRRPGGESGNSSDARLDREASNLPYCINHLQSNDAYGHKLLCKWINLVFPSVKWIQAPPLSNGTFQLRCLPTAPEDRRDDLAIPLTRMGTGIGNVIAMLYVVLTSRQPQVIAIDEPNSFLHPRALRELLQILAIEGKQHQFILTAHSADVLTAVNPSIITMFDFDGASTTIHQVDAKNISAIRSGLSDLGIRMTDLHGRDRVIWVEGQTEEIVLPELLRFFCPEIAAGTAVLRVEHTGTFEKKGVDPSEVAKLYHRLTESSALVPPMIAILLDSESRKKDECIRLERESKGVLRFLDRTMLENYILFPEAIVAVLNALGENVNKNEVEAAMTSAGFPNSGDISNLNGANILKNVFSNLSMARHEFNKTRDVPEIISWLLENRYESLQPLGVFLRSIAALK